MTTISAKNIISAIASMDLGSKYCPCEHKDSPNFRVDENALYAIDMYAWDYKRRKHAAMPTKYTTTYKKQTIEVIDAAIDNIVRSINSSLGLSVNGVTYFHGFTYPARFATNSLLNTLTKNDRSDTDPVPDRDDEKYQQYADGKDVPAEVIADRIRLFGYTPAAAPYETEDQACADLRRVLKSMLAAARRAEKKAHDVAQESASYLESMIDNVRTAIDRFDKDMRTCKYRIRYDLYHAKESLEEVRKIIEASGTRTCGYAPA